MQTQRDAADLLIASGWSELPAVQLGSMLSAVATDAERVRMLGAFHVCDEDAAPDWLRSVGLWMSDPVTGVHCIRCAQSFPCGCGLASGCR